MKGSNRDPESGLAVSSGAETMVRSLANAKAANATGGSLADANAASAKTSSLANADAANTTAVGRANPNAAEVIGHVPGTPDLLALNADEMRFAVRPTAEQDWSTLKAVRLSALAESPEAFGVTLAEALANPDQQWRDRAAGRGAGRFFLAFASTGAAPFEPGVGEYGNMTAAAPGAIVARQESPGNAATQGSGGAALDPADRTVEGAVGMVAAVRVPDGSINLIAMWVDPRWRGMPPTGTTAATGIAGYAAAVRHRAAGGNRTAGVADALIDAVKKHAATEGAPAVLLEVAPDNTRAVALYRRHGFCFHDHVEQLASHPHIMIQRMGWVVPAPD